MSHRLDWLIARLNYATNTSFCQMWQSRVLWKLLSCEPHVHVYSRFNVKHLKFRKYDWSRKGKKFSNWRIWVLIDTAAYFLSNNLLDLFTIFSRKYAKVNCVWYDQREHSRIYKLYISSVNAYYYFNACKVNTIT